MSLCQHFILEIIGQHYSFQTLFLDKHLNQRHKVKKPNAPIISQNGTHVTRRM